MPLLDFFKTSFNYIKNSAKVAIGIIGIFLLPITFIVGIVVAICKKYIQPKFKLKDEILGNIKYPYKILKEGMDGFKQQINQGYHRVDQGLDNQVQLQVQQQNPNQVQQQNLGQDHQQNPNQVQQQVVVPNQPLPQVL